MLGVFVINTTYKNKRNSDNHDITKEMRPNRKGDVGDRGWMRRVSLSSSMGRCVIVQPGHKPLESIVRKL